jgi:hypothetical protein
MVVLRQRRRAVRFRVFALPGHDRARRVECVAVVNGSRAASRLLGRSRTDSFGERMRTSVLSEPFDYDGSQLTSLFAYHRAGIQGDSVIAWVGACEVGTDSLVDQEDVKAGTYIRAAEMLHVIAESFGERLETMVLRQRLFARLAADLLAERSGRPVDVRGDDVFVADRKASVSIATVSPVSALFHFGLNVNPDGAPVPAIGLAELGVAALPFAEALLERYRAECDDVRLAAAKVRWVP